MFSRMQYILYRVCVNLIGIGVASLLMDNINATSYYALISSALILTFFQAFLRPLLVFLTLPFQILSLGIGYIIINSMLLMLTSHFIPELEVNGFWTAFFGSMLISFINLIFDSFQTGSRFKIYFHKGGRF